MKTKNFIYMTILFFLMQPFLFALETLGSGLTRYRDAVQQGVIQQKIQIQYDRDIYESHEIYSKSLSIISKFGVQQMTSNPVRGFDKTMPKTEFTLKAAFTTSGTNNGSVDITLASGDKDQMIERQKLLFTFTPTDTSTHTNECYVYSKTVSGDTGDVQITVKPCNAGRKFGIAGTTEVPADTTFIKAMGTFFADSSTSVAPVSFHETVIENFYSFIKNPYSYNELASRQNLYDKKTLRYRLDSDAKKVFLGMKEDDFLFCGDAYYKYISAATDAAGVQISKMKGLIKAIKDGGSAANQTYATAAGFFDAHEAFCWGLADPQIPEPRRLVICDQAYQKFWTDLKRDRPGIELSPNNAWGIPGITTVYTGIGNLVLDLLVHDRISKWQRLKLANATDKPFAMAIVPYNIKLYDMLPDTLYTEIQANDATDHKAEYRCAFSWLGHNLDTGRFGIIEYAA